MAFHLVRQFLKLESASGILLFVTALAALIVCNSPISGFYQAVWQYPVHLHVGSYRLTEPLIFWINEGLMTLFFLIVGLELKREFYEGALAKFSQVVLPGVAALGGMIVPAIIYCVINYQNPAALHGWAVPVATDIAFALGVLSLFGKRVPLALKIFLLALAIFDDIGAIIIIAVFHSQSLSYWSILMAVLLLFLLYLFNRNGVNKLLPYLFVGAFLWLCVLQSGVHATIAGVLLAFLIPLREKADAAPGPLFRLEAYLHPWVAYLVMPLFAFANAGLSLTGMPHDTLFHPIVLGVVLGLFFGKQIGVFSGTWLFIKFGWAKLPAGSNFLGLFGIAILCGIGFTMSLFLGTLAFEKHYPIGLAEVRLGVLVGSLLSGLVGAFVLHLALTKKSRV